MLGKLFIKIRAFFQPKKGSDFALYKILGFHPNNLNLYHEALIHRSFPVEDGNGHYRNNERLEFLGDTILDAIVGDIIYRKYPAQNEGFLTTTRSKIVRRESLNRIALQLKLNRLVISTTRVQEMQNNILGNALEAFIGAVYLDQGYYKTKKFVENKIIRPYIDWNDIVQHDDNFKSQLLEWCQKHHVRLEFEVLARFTTSNGHLMFQSLVLLNRLESGIGTGYCKKDSEQQAAQQALKKIRTDKAFFNLIQDAVG